MNQVQSGNAFFILGSFFHSRSQNEPNSLSSLECFIFPKNEVKMNRTIIMNSTLAAKVVGRKYSSKLPKPLIITSVVMLLIRHDFQCQ